LRYKSRTTFAHGVGVADSPFYTCAGGAGLGLALVKELVTAMGGTVSAESTLGCGSKFSITLRQADV